MKDNIKAYCFNPNCQETGKPVFFKSQEFFQDILNGEEKVCRRCQEKLFLKHTVKEKEYGDTEEFLYYATEALISKNLRDGFDVISTKNRVKMKKININKRRIEDNEYLLKFIQSKQSSTRSNQYLDFADNKEALKRTTLLSPKYFTSPIKLDQPQTHPALQESFLLRSFIKGIDLNHWTESENQIFTKKNAQELIESILPILILLEKVSLVHCDINPSNIISDESLSSFTLIDYGICFLCNKKQQKKRELFFTTGYQSIEQVENPNKVTARTDLHGLGVTLIMLLLGRTNKNHIVTDHSLVSRFPKEKLSENEYEYDWQNSYAKILLLNEEMNSNEGRKLVKFIGRLLDRPQQDSSTSNRSYETAYEALLNYSRLFEKQVIYYLPRTDSAVSDGLQRYMTPNPSGKSLEEREQQEKSEERQRQLEEDRFRKGIIHNWYIFFAGIIFSFFLGFFFHYLSTKGQNLNPLTDEDPAGNMEVRNPRKEIISREVTKKIKSSSINFIDIISSDNSGLALIVPEGGSRIPYLWTLRKADEPQKLNGVSASELRQISSSFFANYTNTDGQLLIINDGGKLLFYDTFNGKKLETFSVEDKDILDMDFSHTDFHKEDIFLVTAITQDNRLGKLKLNLWKWQNQSNWDRFDFSREKVNGFNVEITSEPNNIDVHFHWLANFTDPLVMVNDGGCVTSYKVPSGEKGQYRYCSDSGEERQGKDIISFAIDENSKYVASIDNEGELRLWDFGKISGSEPNDSISLGPDPRDSLESSFDMLFTPDANFLVIGLPSGDIHIYKVLSNGRLSANPYPIDAHNPRDVHALAIIKQGNTVKLLSGGKDGSIHKWDIDWEKVGQEIMGDKANE